MKKKIFSKNHRENLSISAKKRYEDPIEREKSRKIMEIRYEDPIEREKLHNALKQYYKNNPLVRKKEKHPRWKGGGSTKKCINCGNVFETTHWRRERSKFCSHDCYSKWLIGKNIGRNSPCYKGIEKICLECGNKFITIPSQIKKGHGKFCSKKCYNKQKSDISKNLHEDPIWFEKKYFKNSGFWYGNVKYTERKIYCEKWNKDLWNRIDTFQNFKSILSGKTKENNSGRALSRHHVYWQEKACCIWDEYSNNYYAMINIGTNFKPIMYKYVIKGDPNKFVLLTSSEHSMVAKDKIKWIKIFEDLIQTKYNGKCYYTKEEFDEKC